MANEFKFSNETKNINSQCKIVVYPWFSDALALDSNDNKALQETGRLDISSQVTMCNYSKSLGSAGTFSFTLTNSPGIGSGDWKDIIRRGVWCLIYMSQDGDLDIKKNVSTPNIKQSEAKKIRCIGYIERVAAKASVNERGAFDITYDVSGRDFHVIYEETTIWHNLFQYEQIMLQSLADTQLNITGNTRLHDVLKTVHDLFFNPTNVKGAKVNNQKSLTTIALQWLLPRDLLTDIGYRNMKSTFWGEVPEITKFSPTSAGIAVESPIAFLSGNAWEQLKKISNPEFHELFTELDNNGKPQLIFRPIPFAIDKSKYPTIGKNITLYKDLTPLVTVPAIDVISFDLGEDNHSRYNSFLVTVTTTLINTEDNVSILKDSGFPKNIQDSIKRHGFRPMHVNTDNIIKADSLQNGAADRPILIEFNELLYDYWNNAIYAETGSAQLIGSNDIKVGKCLKFTNDVPYVNSKRFYIEGYSDTWAIENEETGASIWTQDVSLTRGFEEQDLVSKRNFASRQTPFTAIGEFTNDGQQEKTKGKN